MKKKLEELEKRENELEAKLHLSRDQKCHQDSELRSTNQSTSIEETDEKAIPLSRSSVTGINNAMTPPLKLPIKYRRRSSVEDQDQDQDQDRGRRRSSVDTPKQNKSGSSSPAEVAIAVKKATQAANKQRAQAVQAVVDAADRQEKKTRKDVKREKAEL